MKIPNQTSPVLRNNMTAGISDGVEQSGWKDILSSVISGVGQVAPIIAGML